MPKIIKNIGLPNKYSYGNLIIKFEYIYPKKKLNDETFINFINKTNVDKDTGEYEIAYLVDSADFKEDNENTNNMDQNNVQCAQS